MNPRALRRLRLLALDVDGVLTDGGMYYGPSGEGLKRFDVKDGMGIRLLREAGVELALISGERSEILRRRAEKLRLRRVYMGVEDKLAVFDRLLRSLRLSPAEAAYMGDDVTDLGPLGRAGVSIAPADAVPEVRGAARWVTERRGGFGAVREVCDAILAALRPGASGRAGRSPPRSAGRPGRR
jgi:3-deoxy-D-manno-octulosonate 8-phosphate phosphatase (KDO 8-P phosphatase)